MTALDHDGGFIVIEDVLDSTDVGVQRVWLADFAAALRGRELRIHEP